jgi:putative transposase
MSRRGRAIFDKLPNLHFITTTITGFKRIFADENKWSDLYCKIIINNLKRELRNYCSNLIAYVIMPTHIHLIIQTPEDKSISDLMRDFKKFSSKEIKSQLYDDGNYDFINVFRQASKTGGHKVWKDRFDDYVITSEHMLEVKMGYIHDNPRRAGLVDEITDWKYSSARNYYLEDNSVIEVGFPHD